MVFIRVSLEKKTLIKDHILEQGRCHKKGAYVIGVVVDGTGGAIGQSVVFAFELG